MGGLWKGWLQRDPFCSAFSRKDDLNSEFLLLLGENGDVLDLLVNEEVDLILPEMLGNNSFHCRKEDYGILFKDDCEVQGLLRCSALGCQSMNIFVLSWLADRGRIHLGDRRGSSALLGQAMPF